MSSIRAAPPSRLTTSVVVATKDRPGLVSRFLESLSRQTLRPDEVVVVDATTPPIADEPVFKAAFCSERLPGSTLVFQPFRPGLTLQRNEGIRVSSGDLVFFFDDDMVLEPGFLEQIVRTFDDHPEYYGGQGTITNLESGRLRGAGGRLVRRAFGLHHDLGDGRFLPSGLARLPYGLSTLSRTEVLSGGLTAYRREVFRDHLFDEKLAGYAVMEDADFSRRVSYCHPLFFQPAARAAHLHATSGRPDSRRMARMFMRNYAYLFRKDFKDRGEGSWRAFGWALTGLGVLHVLRRDWPALVGHIEGVVRAGLGLDSVRG